MPPEQLEAAGRPVPARYTYQADVDRGGPPVDAVPSTARSGWAGTAPKPLAPLWLLSSTAVPRRGRQPSDEGEQGASLNSHRSQTGRPRALHRQKPRAHSASPGAPLARGSLLLPLGHAWEWLPAQGDRSSFPLVPVSVCLCKVGSRPILGLGVPTLGYSTRCSPLGSKKAEGLVVLILVSP